jgi:hypothetical protein
MHEVGRDSHKLRKAPIDKRPHRSLVIAEIPPSASTPGAIASLVVGFARDTRTEQRGFRVLANFNNHACDLVTQDYGRARWIGIVKKVEVSAAHPRCVNLDNDTVDTCPGPRDLLECHPSFSMVRLYDRKHKFTHRMSPLAQRVPSGPHALLHLTLH